MAGTTIENSEFRRILSRNVALPLGMSIISAVVFVGIIAYLINNLTWVEHSQKVIGNAHEIRKLSAEMESGMRGYLLAGDEEFLAPYLLSAQRMGSSLDGMEDLVKDNGAQADRIKRISQIQKQWETFANEMITRRRANDLNYIEAVRSGRGRLLHHDVLVGGDVPAVVGPGWRRPGRLRPAPAGAPVGHL
jgi:CHASE3 domain sensor protein